MAPLLSVSFLFPEGHTKGITQDTYFQVWLLSLGMVCFIPDGYYLDVHFPDEDI